MRKLETPRITIVTPSFNQGCYIEETIVSVISQDYANVEYIVMDGGSTDGTLDILRKYDSRIDYWVSAKDGGQSDALDRGFARATGDILAWVNSDDSLAPGALAAIAAAFEGSDADLVAGIVNVQMDGRLVYRHRTGLRAGVLRVDQILDLEDEWLKGRFFYQPEVFFSRAIYAAAGGTIDTDLRYSMDFDLWLRLAEAGARILPIDHEIANFRVHADQKTSQISAFLPELTAHANAARRRHGLSDVFPGDPTAVSRRALRVGMLNDFGFSYGAGRAHRRIASSLAASGVEVFLFAFREGVDDDAACVFAEAEDAFAAAEVDVVIVGNLHGAFPEGADLTRLAALAPVLLVTHDFFWFTGRCAYPMECGAFFRRCPSTCPTRESYPVIRFDDIPEAHRRKLRQLEHPDIYVAANSDYLASAVTRFLAAALPSVDPDQKVRRVHLGVIEACYTDAGPKADLTMLDLPADGFIVLTASSHVDDPRKGFRDVLAAVRRIGDPRVRLVAIGQATPSGRQLDVHYTGLLDRDEDLASWYRAADIYISASADESFGQTFVEAAMCGCPSVGYAAGGVRETILPGSTGWLVPKGDVAGLSACIETLIGETPSSRSRRRARAHVHAASKFGAPTLLAGLNDILRDIVPDDAISIAKGVQFGGGRNVPTRWICARRVTPRGGFDPPEGPFPQYGIADVLHWQTESVGLFEVTTPKPGAHLVTLQVGNIAKDQVLVVRHAGREMLRTALPVMNWRERFEVDMAIDLPAGTSEIEVSVPASVHDEASRRDLHLAAFQGRVSVADRADGLRAVRHLVLVEDQWQTRDDLRCPDPGSIAFSERLQLLAGFDSVEGPYQSLGVRQRLAWQVQKSGIFEFFGPEDSAGSVAIDLMLPCQQDLKIEIGEETLRYPNLSASDWERPTRVILPSSHFKRGWVRVAIEAEESVRDEAGRSLHVALLEVNTGSVPCADSDCGAYDIVFHEHALEAR